MSSQSEREDLLETLAKHRGLFRRTVQGVSDADAARRTTVSELCLGGLIKHVTLVEQIWADFILNGPRYSGPPDAATMQDHAASFRMGEGDTLADLLARYHETAEATDELVRTLPSLDDSQPLPEAPWFPPTARWTARRTFMHVIAETAQHAGHADILREAIDGAKTMG
ncbi:MAG TPA: DinB family protein [Acidimicrobiales bacterium]|nr:DinB family protein [Acidimicrobiales bacterium]